jgi:alanyl-tRNA synthetase
MKSGDIRSAFLSFFADRGHAILPSAPVVPQHDPTVLFITAGMHPLVPFLLGEPHPGGKRLASVQKCIRTTDIDEVGDDTHATFLEMLGNWSLGDYFKKESIEWTWEFLTKVLKLDPRRMAVSVFAGDEDAPRDEEAAALWREQPGFLGERVYYYGKEDNWWGPAGETGPCGPDTEVFYWVGDDLPGGEPATDDRWIEVWNNVFMQYNKTADGTFAALAQRNVDTGMGLERISAIMQQADNIYATDLFTPLLKSIAAISSVDDQRASRIVADHLKAATFMLADGVRPSNVERGYILRRLIRRAIRQARHLGIAEPFVATIAQTVIAEYGAAYPELRREESSIIAELGAEENKFARTLERGIKEFEKRQTLTGKELFFLFETYGFPFELGVEELRHHHGDADETILRRDFDAAFTEHQKKSRSGAEQKFAGGLADHSAEVVKLHTATHLLNAALQNVLGEHVKQRGSNITAQRLRFDFSHPEKLTEEQLHQVEAQVNEWIKEDLPVTRREMSRSEAERVGAQMEFGHKYPDTVSVYFVGDPESATSKEFCGGPHVEHTGVIGTFQITKQESVGAGVRRIKAVVA